MPPSKRHRPRVPLEQRKRSVQACIPCRETKKKCLLASNDECENCSRSGQVCVFNRVPKQHDQTVLQESHKPSRYASTSWETLTKEVYKKFNQCCPKNTLDPDQFSVLSGLFCEAVNPHSPYLASHASHARDTPGHPSPPPLDLSDPESVFSSPSPSGSVVDRSSSQSHASFVAAVSEIIPTDEVEVQDLHLPSAKTSIPANNLASQEDSALVGAVLAHLPPYEEAQSLVAVFFMYIESNWYYFEERWFRDLLAQLYWDACPARPQPPCTTVCLVLLVLALGSSFKHLWPYTRPHSPNTGAGLEDVPGRNLFTQAMRLMPGTIDACSMESVLCCLLTALYLLPTQNISRHYAYLGLALRLAISLSLHRKGSDSKVTSQERELRTRVFWSIYCIERQMSIVMGSPTMLQLKDITVPLPQSRQDLDQFDSPRVDRLIAFTKLNLVMSKVLDASPIEQSPSRFAWACSLLETWKQSLPAHLLLTEDSSLRATAHLDILYHLTWINLGKRCTLRLVRNRLHHSTADSPKGKLHTTTTNLQSQELSERCTQAAVTIIEWIDLMRSRKRLSKFSFTDIHSCSSAVIILLLKAVLQPEEQWLAPIARGIEALRFIASDNKLARDALYLVERLQVGVHKSIQKFAGDSSPTQGKHSGSTARSQPTPPPQSGLLPGQVSSQVDNVPTPFLPAHGDTGGDTTGSSTADYTAASGFEMLDSGLLSDLESSLVGHSDQALALFGFDSFSAAVTTTTDSRWNWDTAGEDPSPGFY